MPEILASESLEVRLVPSPLGGSLSPEEAEARLRKEGYECFVWYDVPGTLYPKHRHVHDECLWVLKGEITFSAQGREFALKTGDKLYLPRQVPHTAKVPAHSSCTYLVGQKRGP